MSQNFGAAQQQTDQQEQKATPQTLPVLPIKESHQLLKDNGKKLFLAWFLTSYFFSQVSSNSPTSNTRASALTIARIRARAKAPKCGHFSVSGPFSCATTSTRKCMASSARRRWLTPRLVIGESFWKIFKFKSSLSYGIECLFRFYSYGLEKKFRAEIYKDFQSDTLADYRNGQLYGLEKFWAFLRYSGRGDQGIQPELRQTLTKFKTVDDFRVLPPEKWLQQWR